MSNTQPVKLIAEEQRDHSFLERLMNPSVDRAIAVVAILPMLWAAYYRYQHYGLNLPVIFILGQYICAGRDHGVPAPAPANHTKPVVLAVGVHQHLFPSSHAALHGPWTPLGLTFVVQLHRHRCLTGVGVGATEPGTQYGIRARPARNCNHPGAYRFVRHPIYTGLILSYLAVVLRIYSPRNTTLLAIAVFWMLVKSFVEESFLRADPQYSAYMTKVRSRWIPFVI